jgi:hypothetical protein
MSDMRRREFTALVGGAGDAGDRRVNRQKCLFLRKPH